MVLPDDMEFMHTVDDFSVKAVRMSTSVPFVFKPVEIKGITTMQKKLLLCGWGSVYGFHLVN